LIDHKTIDDLARRLSEALPDGVRTFQHDVEKNMRAILTSTFTRLDLVTRDELDIQKDVLARTRAQLTELENKLAILQQQLDSQKNTDG